MFYNYMFPPFSLGHLQALRVMYPIQGVTGGTDQTSGGCSLC